jgi:hypothetical protein
MKNIYLNFINKTDADAGKVDVVFYQRNFAIEFGEIAVAWKVIQNSERLDQESFKYSTNYSIAIADSFGNYTPQVSASNGASYDVIEGGSGIMPQISSIPAGNPEEIEIRNSLKTGEISTNCYRDGKLLATRTNINPGEKAFFEFKPQLFIGVVSGIQQGDVLYDDVITLLNSQINLFGVTSADIVLKGGGTGSASVPFSVALENINRL